MLATLLLMFTTGCVLPDENLGQSGEEAVVCAPVTTTEFALGDTTPLGFTGQEVVDLVVGDHAATLTWALGGTTDLVVGVSSDATVVTWRDMEMQDDGSGAEIAMLDTVGCADDVVLAATVQFTTTDGAFAETWDLDLGATAADEVYVFTELALDALSGTYTVTEVDPAEYDEVRAFLDLALTGEGVSGVIDGQGEKVEGDVASATAFDIATFE